MRSENDEQMWRRLALEAIERDAARPGADPLDLDPRAYGLDPDEVAARGVRIPTRPGSVAPINPRYSVTLADVHEWPLPELRRWAEAGQIDESVVEVEERRRGRSR